MPTRAPDDAGFGERRIEDAVVAGRALQSVRDLEDAALALDLVQCVLRLASATSSPKTTMRGLCAISSFSVRLIASTIVSGLPSGCAGVSKAAEVGIDVGRVDVQRRRVRRLSAPQRLFGRDR